MDPFRPAHVVVVADCGVALVRLLFDSPLQLCIEVVLRALHLLLSLYDVYVAYVDDFLRVHDESLSVRRLQGCVAERPICN